MLHWLILPFYSQRSDYDQKKADEKNEDLSRRNRELGKKCSSMEHQKMAGEAGGDILSEMRGKLEFH